ncbi:MAG: peptidase [Bacillaceae bacterium]|nr:peptidase [Bacillaceae bacterium]
MGTVTLLNQVVKKNRVDFYFHTEGKIKKYFSSKHHLFLQYNENISTVPKSILSIPFVANIIPLIWISNSKLYVQELDKNFYDCLQNIKAAYQKMFPKVHFKGELVVEKFTSNSFIPKNEAAMLFSGGVDAMTTFFRIKEKSPILITEYGWYENDIKASEVWNADKDNAVSFAKKHGLSNILIQSNYGTFILGQRITKDFGSKLQDTWWHGLHHSLALLSAAIPATYKLKVDCIFIGSSYFSGYDVTCASHPTVDNEIKYASGSVFHDAFDLNRQKKISFLVKNKEKVDLRVCFRQEENCCRCEKCLRTIVGIVAEGENPSKFGFKLPIDTNEYIKNFLKENIKFFTRNQITVWKLSQDKMKINSQQFKEFEWFFEYDFYLEKKKALLHYRTTKFFIILKRRMKESLTSLLSSKSYR